MENVTKVFGLPCVVAINRFPLDTEAELALIADKCQALGVNVALSEVWAKGGEGGRALAEEVVRLCEQPHDFRPVYDLDTSIEEKLHAIVTKIYRGRDVVLTKKARKQAAQLTAEGYGNYPICMAKTQYSFSDNAELLGAPGELHRHRAEPEGLRRGGVHRGPHRGHPHHARPAQGSLRREDRRGREREDHGLF